ncbi:MAG TPA: peptidoglycan DD-metalloendopeptidase family protein [Puia sp.]|nr:peptidoglycan DD-metalloendopeptidase family protein [Puia sp.]
MPSNLRLDSVLKDHRHEFSRVVPFDETRDSLLRLDFTENNPDLTPADIADTEKFATYIKTKLATSGAAYGIGGYGEHRTLYGRSRHFDSGEEPRRLHLGTDIWGPAGTRVMAPLQGIIHSFAFNNNESDYGATIILTHILDGLSFYTLYGHLSLNSLKNLYEGKRIVGGEVFTEFGMRFENGNWPPHLHFQIIRDLGNWNGDYPGVCRYSEKEHWLDNCPDPDQILGLKSFVAV